MLADRGGTVLYYCDRRGSTFVPARAVKHVFARSDNVVLIQMTVSAGRSLEKKRRLYRRIADNLAALGLRREDAWINLVEVAKENWSFGNGIASYAPAETALA